MPRDEDDDLYDEDFDFVDDDDDEEEEVDNGSEEAAEEAEEPEPPAEPVTERPRRGGRRPRAASRRSEPRDEPQNDDFGRGLSDAEPEQADEAVDEYGRPEPAPNYVVHIYEHKKFKRTIERPFTPEEAEAFATEYNRTAKSYGRFALAGKNDAKPKKVLE